MRAGVLSWKRAGGVSGQWGDGLAASSPGWRHDLEAEVDEVPAPRLSDEAATTTGCRGRWYSPAAMALTKAGLAVAHDVEHAQLSEDRGGRADRGHRFAPLSARRSTYLIAGVAFRFVVPGRLPGRNKCR